VRADHFFTSDLHFGDEHLLTAYEGRPFDTVGDADEAMVKRWNDVVGKRDLVWVLGDVTTDTGPSEHIARLNGTKYLIAGNHDTCSQLVTPNDRERATITRAWLDSGFAQVVDGSGIARSGIPVRIPLRGISGTVALSHYPYDPAPWEVGKPDAFARWRPKRPARGPVPWLIHGHVHAAWAVQGTQINVGVGLWDFEPVPAEILAGLMLPAAE
jgi:calcineurin-like phosphoesterase family protein